MLSNPESTPRIATLLTGLAMGESPRWHDDRLWFSDWGAQEIRWLAVGVKNRSTIVGSC